MPRTYAAVSSLLLLAAAGYAQIEGPVVLEGGDFVFVPAEPGDTNVPMPLTPRGVPESIQVNTLAGANIVGDAGNEPTIAVDPTAPNRIAIGWRQFDTQASDFRQAGYAFSRDGGRTWSGKLVFDPGVFRTDPVMVSELDGTFHYLTLRTDPYLCELTTSTDGGATWEGIHFAYGGDKAWFTIDNTGGPETGNLYQAWNTAGNQFAPNQFNLSRDGGRTWTMPIEIPGRPVFGTVDVGPDGTVRVAGRSFSGVPGTLAIATVRPPFATFEPTRFIDFGGVYTLFTGPNPAGLLGQVETKTNHAPGPRHGEVYVIAPVRPAGSSDPLDLHFVYSSDGGVSFSDPVRINDDAGGAWQWFGTMDVAPNGRIDVVWNDTRDTPNLRLSALYYSFSLDGGRTWSANERMTAAWDSYLGWPSQNKIGDYYHLHSDNVGADLAFATTFNGEQDVYYLRIGDRDCNGNGIGDAEDLSAGVLQDCDADGVPDSCEIAAGAELDVDGDGVPDACQRACLADADDSGAVEVMDLLLFLDGWFEGALRVDVNGDGRTDVFDLLGFLDLWFAGC